jgi:hypothetical protein
MSLSLLWAARTEQATQQDKNPSGSGISNSPRARMLLAHADFFNLEGRVCILHYHCTTGMG